MRMQMEEQNVMRYKLLSNKLHILFRNIFDIEQIKELSIL